MVKSTAAGKSCRWRDNYERFYSERGWGTSLATACQEVGRIAASAEWQRGDPIVDLGCGEGVHTEALRRAGFAARGVDISPAGIARARSRYPAAEFVVADLAEWEPGVALAGILCRGMSWFHYELGGVNRHGIDVPHETARLFSFVVAAWRHMALQISTDFSGSDAPGGTVNNTLAAYLRLFHPFGEPVLLTDWHGQPFGASPPVSGIVLVTRKALTMIPCHNVEVHVSHACNLACDNCTHFSDYGFAGHLSPEVAAEWFDAWGRRLRPKWFSLLGGEPTLNPRLCEFLPIARRCFPDSLVQLVTNGFFLHRHPELPALLEQHAVSLEVSQHHDGPAYRERFEAITSLLADWQSRHAIKVNLRSSHGRWRRLYRLSGRDIRPFADGDPEAAWSICEARECLNIHNGHLFKCPPLAYLPLVAAKFEIDRDAWRPWLDYEPLPSDCSDAELAEFVGRGPEAVCAFCPASRHQFRLRSPLRGVADDEPAASECSAQPGGTGYFGDVVFQPTAIESE